MNWFKWLHFVGLYYRQPRWDTGISPPELIAFLESHPASRALDLGCGTGTNAITMAGYGWQVTGVDFVGRAIRAGRRKAKAAASKLTSGPVMSRTWRVSMEPFSSCSI